MIDPTYPRSATIAILANMFFFSHEEYTAVGIPDEWIDPILALGYDTVEKLKALEKPV